MATSDRSSTATSHSSLEPDRLNSYFGRQPIATAAGELVKCNENEELDWNTLGKILTASTLGEALCTSYADFKHGRMTRGSNVNIDWKFAYEEKGIIILRKKQLPQDRHNSQNLVCFAGRGVVDFPVSQVAAVVSDPAYCNIWNKFLVETRVVKVVSETERSKDIISYYRHENSHCFIRTKRDFLLFIRSIHMEDDKFVLAAISVDHPCCPKVEGITRAQCCLGSGWVLEPYEGRASKTLVTYIANIDLYTPLPTSMTRKMLQYQPLAIHYLKKFLKSSHRVYRGYSLNPNGSVCNKVEESEFETSITSTVRVGCNSSFTSANTPSNFYFDPMGVDHFTGPPKPFSSKKDISMYQEKDGGYASLRKSTLKSDTQERSTTISENLT